MSSLADQAVETLAAVAAIGEGLTNDDPWRHAIRNLKRSAQDIITNALRQALDLAYQAEQLRCDMKGALEASQAPAPQAEQGGDT